MQDPKVAAQSPDYLHQIDVVEGATLVAERFCIILNWISKGKYIADVQTSLDPRKRVLQDNDVLPPPPTPTNMFEKCALLGIQYTDRNQRLSCLTITYGRESLLFRDVCFFEDGLILTIHRYLVPLQEMLDHPQGSMVSLTVAQRTEKVKESVLDFYDGLSKSRINAVNHTLPLLDYSFVEVTEPLKLLQTAPTAGKRHNPRDVRPQEDPRFAQGVFLSEATDPTANAGGAGKRTMIKAKNKRGEEEAYEFDGGEGDRFAFMRGTASDNTGKKEGTVEALVASAATEAQYDANSVRIASCGLSQHTERLVPVLRRLVANALITLTALDLSDNKISVLPSDFHQLPLQKLQLHGNCITDFKEVVDKVCPLPYLAFVTLHGNPIADNSEQYWPLALRHLLRHPNRQVKLKSLDFVILTAQDYNVAGAHDMFERGDDTLLKKAKTISSGRPTTNTDLYESKKMTGTSRSTLRK
ncbi:hypothetical protein AGDE_05421 [Angomonas deanei]|uniref:Leucine-rich repeat-containing protein 51 n=1 Tax=Angomonas deanei TaxID=59799 RepID=A0A7G2CQV2_9TRYP|nr:hypothetical protein AGDE_05421 [Angomonas deanei]CAD2222140.1 hypothetical protein, conserved [Angomonas deanei]|eukprot:EPY38508.1 hypothetical protein AGDE_05421 [Angomonas deanei]